MTAATEAPSAIDGKIRFWACVDPNEGRILNQKEKIRIKIIASQKFGTDAAVSDPIVEIRSKIEYCFIAEYIPIGMPTASANSMLVTDRSIVFGNA
jgi:hypothetical protein